MLEKWTIALACWTEIQKVQRIRTFTLLKSHYTKGPNPIKEFSPFAILTNKKIYL